MGYFDERKNVDEYNRMADGFDGRELIGILGKHLQPGSTVLELGMGPGKDLDLLAQTYTVTGSDVSRVFLDLYRAKHPASDLLLLDAVDIETDRTFDCIYSNKVLHHIPRAQLRRSFQRQRDILNDNGLLMHSFWYGDTEEEYSGMRFVYYTEESLVEAIGGGFEVEQIDRYEEMEAVDSFYILLRKTD